MAQNCTRPNFFDTDHAYYLLLLKDSEVRGEAVPGTTRAIPPRCGCTSKPIAAQDDDIEYFEILPQVVGTLILLLCNCGLGVSYRRLGEFQEGYCKRVCLVPSH